MGKREWNSLSSGTLVTESWHNQLFWTVVPLMWGRGRMLVPCGSLDDDAAILHGIALERFCKASLRFSEIQVGGCTFFVVGYLDDFDVKIRALRSWVESGCPGNAHTGFWALCLGGIAHTDPRIRAWYAPDAGLAWAFTLNTAMKLPSAVFL